MAGIGFALVAFLVLAAIGAADGGVGAAALIFLQYTAQIGGGFVGGRLAGHSRVVHGGLAGLAMAVIGAAVGLGLAGRDANMALVFLALAIALTTGSAGGALAEYVSAGNAEDDNE